MYTCLFRLQSLALHLDVVPPEKQEQVREATWASLVTLGGLGPGFWALPREHGTSLL